MEVDFYEVRRLNMKQLRKDGFNLIFILQKTSPLEQRIRYLEEE